MTKRKRFFKMSTETAHDIEQKELIAYAKEHHNFKQQIDKKNYKIVAFPDGIAESWTK